MKKIARIAVTATAAVLSGVFWPVLAVSSSPRPCDFKSMQEAIDVFSAREGTKQWQKIKWRTSAAQALRDAQTEGKPIFVFFVVRQKAPSPKKWVAGQNDMGKT